MGKEVLPFFLHGISARSEWARYGFIALCLRPDPLCDS